VARINSVMPDSDVAIWLWCIGLSAGHAQGMSPIVYICGREERRGRRGKHG
jgi:hypothetical protein